MTAHGSNVALLSFPMVNGESKIHPKLRQVGRPSTTPCTMVTYLNTFISLPRIVCMHFKYAKQDSAPDDGIELENLEALVEFVKARGSKVITPDGELLATAVD